MRYLIFTVIVTLVFSPAAVSADTKKRLDDLEQRVTDIEDVNTQQDAKISILENQVADHETELYVLEQNQSDLQSDVADHEGRITALEGLSFGAALGVYDGNDVFLGYLITIGDSPTPGQTQDDFLVFDPNTSSTFWVNNTPTPTIGGLAGGCTEVFTSSDCSGQTYAPTSYPARLHYCSHTDQYMVVDTSVPPVLGTATVAHIEHHGSGLCEAGGTSYTHAYPLKNIDFRLAEVTLAYPITVRPIQQP